MKQEQQDEACKEFIYEQLNMTASYVKITPVALPLMPSEPVPKLKFDSETCTISVNGEEIGKWNDEASIDYPEDLIWRRDIGSFAHEMYMAGFKAGQAKAGK
jgi:hypothetical protein